MAVMRTACLLNLLVVDQRAHDTKAKPGNAGLLYCKR
jgi:hypothetical protein